MATWDFPNAIAEAVRREARMRGQTKDRVISRDSTWNWPEPPRVKRWARCPRTWGFGSHDAVGDVAFCSMCGALVEE